MGSPTTIDVAGTTLGFTCPGERAQGVLQVDAQVESEDGIYGSTSTSAQDTRYSYVSFSAELTPGRPMHLALALALTQLEPSPPPPSAFLQHSPRRPPIHTPSQFSTLQMTRPSQPLLVDDEHFRLACGEGFHGGFGAREGEE